ncbi:pyridoxal-phosphate dependent enzyme [Maioricimonas sp. JC845]|uniref:pyridoxal-phosphate dependent enzyme n=1 Tax=Maioricimonas sp. JC845 TaxID=3232138 RepID=UPI00345B40BC
MSIWRFADAIEDVPADSRISLGEGDTPLIRSRQIGPAAGLKNLYFKLEMANPCGSFKDRFAAAAISHMIAAGQTECIATSSGNTGAALAAYCAAAGIRCRIAIVETAPFGKVKQMLAYGADIFRVNGFGLDADITSNAFAALQKLGSQPGRALQISGYVFSPKGMSGCQTVSHELAEQLPDGIDHVFCPAGGGGLCVGAARGFHTLVSRGVLERSPAVEVVQPEGNNTIAGPLAEGQPQAQPITCTSKISGLQVASVVDGDLAIEECRPTGGTGHLVTDEFIWEVQKRLAREEGIFSEPAGAVALAGALSAARAGRVDPDATIVCLVTGSGFKDEASLDRMIADVDCPMIDVGQLQEEAEVSGES